MQLVGADVLWGPLQLSVTDGGTRPLRGRPQNVVVRTVPYACRG